MNKTIISISPRVPEWPDSEYIGHIVSKTVIKHWVDSNVRSTPKSQFGCRTKFNARSKNTTKGYLILSNKNYPNSSQLWTTHVLHDTINLRFFSMNILYKEIGGAFFSNY